MTISMQESIETLDSDQNESGNMWKVLTWSSKELRLFSGNLYVDTLSHDYLPHPISYFQSGHLNYTFERLNIQKAQLNTGF